MGKQIQAYFRNENDAVDVRSKLNKYNATAVETSELPEAINGDDSRFLFPVVAAAAPGHTTGIGNLVAPAGVPGVAAGTVGTLGILDVSGQNTFGIDDNAHKLTHTITAEVAEEDYEDVVNTIRQNHGYVENFEK
ncbi:hypothetical protein [Paenibacillus gansuensis]|uniref:General stress protein 17M-like domain-containing protein n=1 Tax=Paenibacillus gansuensis TaxID=306542 RepID=A0ABW5PIK3_9BACL